MSSRDVPLRQQTRGVVRGLIAQTATQLFADRGYDETTLDDVAAAAGTSRRTLFNYFKSKEDLALSALDEQGEFVAARLAEVNPEVDAWSALRTGFQVLDEFPASGERRLRLVQLLFESESLRAGHAEKQARWQDLLAPLIVERIPTGPLQSLQARSIVASAITCLQLATEEWARQGGSTPLFDLYDAAIAGVRA